MITRVTITGADNSIYPSELIEISEKFPFVEWGILFSGSRIGTPRFPSLDWVDNLAAIKRQHTNMALSAHLCGRHVRQIIKGDDSGIFDLYGIWNIFERVQLNTHGIPHAYHETMTELLKKYPEKEFIFQYDEVNYKPLQLASQAGVRCSALFDKSGGAGVLPDQWPALLPDIPCGYAGGLGPDNLLEQILLIEEKAGETAIWIDMETHIRSNDDQLFDMDKVIKCLEISEPFVNGVSLPRR